jgi:hypothetical protein
VREIIREGSAEMGKEHSKALRERPQSAHDRTAAE